MINVKISANIITEINFQYWYSSVAEFVEATIFVGFFCGRFDASISSATTGSTTTTNDDFI